MEGLNLGLLLELRSSLLKYVEGTRCRRWSCNRPGVTRDKRGISPGGHFISTAGDVLHTLAYVSFYCFFCWYTTSEEGAAKGLTTVGV